MVDLYGRKPAVKAAETIFNLLYLLTVFTCAAILLTGGKGAVSRLYGLCALVLASGDSIHIFPRLTAMWDGKRNYSRALGIGKQVASVTMTLFYAGIWAACVIVYDFSGALTVATSVAVAVLSAMRIVLCVMPQNAWTRGGCAKSWAVYRNLPFFLLGAIVAAGYAVGAFVHGVLGGVWIMIALSFAFYIPVVLFSAKKPAWGMLMLPKCCAYAAMIIMFL